MKKIVLFSIGLAFVFSNTHAQKNNADATLFTYGGKNVGKKEFLRMYTKNINNQKPDFSEKAVREYLTLYSRFKMKVAEADAMQMDTLKNIDSELGTYKKQLAKTYLTDTEVKDKLVKEAYDRSKKDVHIAHILVQLPRNTDDTTATYRKMDSIYNEITSGRATFGMMAKTFSEDKQSAINNGDIGFITPLQIVYPFENAAYNTPVGKISRPFRTIYGYHLINKIEDRPARGDIQVAQILIATKKSEGAEGEARAKARVDSVMQLLKKGQSFDALVDKYSDDKYSINSKGVLPTFGVGQMLAKFEDAAFALKKPGDYSEPIKTDYGYHIIKLINKIPVKPFDSVKTELSKRIEKDSRTDIARVEYTQKVKQKLNYKDYPANLTQLINAIDDSSLVNTTYKASNYAKYKAPLFTMTGTEFTQSDFAKYLEAYTKNRMYGSKETTLRSLYKNYADKAVNDFQENRLIDDNEEYRNLINEYKDGIMLFELTDRTVWSKASSDTVGLANFYEKNKSKYQWGPSVKGTIYKVANEDVAKQLVKELNNPANKNLEAITNAVEGAGFKGKIVSEKGKFDKGRFPASLKMVAGKYSPYYKNDDGTYTLLDIEEVNDAPTQKTLTEARGYVISEYQEYLEKKWIADLETKYPVSVNESTLKSIIK